MNRNKVNEPKDKNVYVRLTNIKEIMYGANEKGLIDDVTFLILMNRLLSCLKVGDRGVRGC